MLKFAIDINEKRSRLNETCPMSPGRQDTLHMCVRPRAGSRESCVLRLPPVELAWPSEPADLPPTRILDPGSMKTVYEIGSGSIATRTNSSRMGR